MILVTGGGGFIGSHVVGELVGAGHQVRVVDTAAPPAGLPADVDYRQGDLSDLDVLVDAVRGVEAVSHQAAKVGLEAGVCDMVDYVFGNDVTTSMLLWALDRADFKGRLVLASSMVVYGEGRYRCADHGVVRPRPRSVDRLAEGRFEPQCPTCGSDLMNEVVPEDAALDPRNVYAATKLHQEHLCQSFGRQRGVAITALRYHNVYGPGMPRDTPYAGVAALFADRVRKGDAPKVFEDGAQKRDFVHVSDVARANRLAIEAPLPVDEAINVASGRISTVLDMALAVVAAFGPEAPTPTVTGDYRLGDVRHIVASPLRADELLGFRAEVLLRDGIAGLVAEYSPYRREPGDPTERRGHAR